MFFVSLHVPSFAFLLCVSISPQLCHFRIRFARCRVSATAMSAGSAEVLVQWSLFVSC